MILPVQAWAGNISATDFAAGINIPTDSVRWWNAVHGSNMCGITGENTLQATVESPVAKDRIGMWGMGMKETSPGANPPTDIGERHRAVHAEGVHTSPVQQMYSIGFTGFTDVSINRTSFTLNTYVDGNADNDMVVKCYYTLDGTEPDTDSPVAYNGHVFSSDETINLNLKYEKGNMGDGLSETVRKRAAVTYSTSENYESYRNNTKSFGGKGTITVFVKSSYTDGFSIWAWDKDKNSLQGEGISWPGPPMTEKTDDGWFYKTYHADEINFKFSHNGDSQSGEIESLRNDAYYFYVGNAIVDPDETMHDGNAGKYVYFVHPVENDYEEWARAACYAWGGSSGNGAIGEWPGREMEKIGSACISVNNKSVRRNLWRVSVEEVAEEASLIFNNGKLNDGEKSQLPDMSCHYGNLYSDKVLGIIPQGGSGTVSTGNGGSSHAEGDMTYRLASEWDGDGTVMENVTDWSKKPVTVNAPKGTASQTITFLKEGTYMVQAIVRGTVGSDIILGLNGTQKTVKAIGMDENTMSQVSRYGRVDALYTGDTGGWQKIENSIDIEERGSLAISLSSTGDGFQFSDVVLLLNPNTNGMFWTTAPTSSDVTFFDVSAQNKFSFFDRGENLNAIVKAGPETVIGMGGGMYDGADRSHPVNVVSEGKCRHLYLTDTDGNGSWTNGHAFGSGTDFKAYAITYDRRFSEGDYATVCLPFSLSAEEIRQLFGTDCHYDFKGTGNDGATVHFTGNGDATTANKPFMIRCGTGDYLTKTVYKEGGVDVSAGYPDTGAFSGTYRFTPLVSYGTDSVYYIFDAERNGRYAKVPDDAAGGDVKPFRAYITCPRTSKSRQYMEAVFDNGGTTGIGTAASRTSSKGTAYGTDGRKIGRKSGTSGMPGNIIYIINGKKYIIK